MTLITIERHLLEQQRHFPNATGTFTGLLYDIALAAKIINRESARAALGNLTGKTQNWNVHGEQQQKLDVFADETLFTTCTAMGRLCAIASEEREQIVTISENAGRYALVFDPLDGSANIDANVSVGTIFGLFRKVSPGPGGSIEDILQPGGQLAAAGYVIYGPATMLVYSAGAGVYGFTLDPSLGEFFLTHRDMKFPARPTYFSANQSQERHWEPSVQHYVKWLQGMEGEPPQTLNARYTGSLVMDFHRNLLYGGMFCYPGDRIGHPNGKLRLLYEAAPLAFIAAQAGGYASDGRGDILTRRPSELHQRTPLFIGNRELIEQAEKYIGADNP